MEATLVIRDLESLRIWAQRARNVLTPRTLPVVQFQFPELSPEQNRSFSMLADEYRKACGCASGGFFMSVAVLATPIAYFASGNRLTDVELRHAMALVGITLLAALLGKLFGLIGARWRALRLAAAIRRSVSSARPTTTVEPA